MKKLQEQLKDLRGLSIAELNSKLREAKLGYQDVASQLAMGKIKAVSQVKAAKKLVARLSSIHREKSILQEVTNG